MKTERPKYYLGDNSNIFNYAESKRKLTWS